jgi:hypothetical protein
LQLDDRSPNAKPDKLPVAIAAFEHFIGSPGCDGLGIGPVLADQQISGSPDIAIRDHSGSFRSAAFLFSAISLRLRVGVLIARRNYRTLLIRGGDLRLLHIASSLNFPPFWFPVSNTPPPFPNRYHRGEVKREAPYGESFPGGYL